MRTFFLERDFVEVQTPLLVSTLAPEINIEPFTLDTYSGAESRYLITSPELNMKRLLASGLDKIFQLGPVFRKGERGSLHLPEFTMLEWYRKKADYRDLMKDCELLLRAAAFTLYGDTSQILLANNKISLKPPFHVIRVDDAFRKWAGWSPLESCEPDRFDHDMVTIIEPKLPKDKPVFLIEYPAWQASLARLSPHDKRVAERVELYINGIELANGFSELVDRKEQEERFKQETARMLKAGREVYPRQSHFLNALDELGECAGMALGIDRLIMVVTGAEKIDEVVAFTPEEC